MLKNYKNLTLSDLALSSTIYNDITPFNNSLRSLKSETGSSIDINNSTHRACLIKLLNDWGCRHLSKEQHETTSAAILDWYINKGLHLLQSAKTVWELNDDDLYEVADIYGDLKDKIAAHRIRRGNTLHFRIGPTAASKILFAMHPEALMPWDEAMRIKFGHDGNARSYLRFLHDIRSLAWKIKKQCHYNGFEISELPDRLERSDSTVLEIINEYIWITVTRKCKLPSASTLANWAKLGLASSKNE